MTIGLIDTNIDTLSLYKEWASRFPAYDYAAYIETRELTDIAKACAWMREKKADVIAVGKGVQADVIRAHEKLALVIPASDIVAYLEGIKTDGGIGTVRSIHITQHNKEQDQQLALLLGGYFVEG